MLGHLLSWIGTALLALVVASSGAYAQVAYVYRAELSGHLVVPPTSSPGYGQLESYFDGGGLWCADSESHLLDSFTFYAGLTGPPTGCYLHRGGPGVNGERLYTLHDGFFPPSGPVITIDFSPEDCADLDAGKIYVVITTDLFPEGEVRGQVFPLVAGPVEPSTWGAIKAVYR